jgi:beta-lactamase class A
MITFLKDAEKDPSLLDRELLMTQRAPVPEATLTAAPLALNRTYKVKDLIRSMIIDSDNDATLLLGQNMNASEFVDLFKDLAIGVPDVNDSNHRMSAKEIARFMRVLYNATYLNPQSSEYALSLLTQTAYKEGLPKYLPKGLTVASKFGERLDEENMQNFHEVGIIYLDGNPYLLSVMTKGPVKENLHSAVAEMSSICYKFMTGQSN